MTRSTSSLMVGIDEPGPRLAKSWILPRIGPSSFFMEALVRCQRCGAQYPAANHSLHMLRCTGASTSHASGPGERCPREEQESEIDDDDLAAAIELSRRTAEEEEERRRSDARQRSSPPSRPPQISQQQQQQQYRQPPQTSVEMSALGGAALGSLLGGLLSMTRGRGTLREGLEGAATGAAYGGILGAAASAVEFPQEESQRDTATGMGRGSGQQRGGPGHGGGGRRPLFQQGGTEGFTFHYSSGPGGGFRRVPGGATAAMPTVDMNRDMDSLRGDLRGMDLELDGLMDTLNQAMAARAGMMMGPHGGGMQPAEERDVDSLPTNVLGQEEAERLPEEHSSCVICMERFKAGDTVKRLPCLHGFHKECIDSWLARNGSCPVCKHRVDGSSQSGDAAEGVD